METQSRFSWHRTLALFLSLILVVTLFALPVSADKHNSEQDAEKKYGKLVEIAIQGKSDYKVAFEVLDKVNAERKKAGLKSLSMDKELLETAMQRAAECSVLYSHTRPQGESCFSILKGNYTHFSAGENIATGQKTSAQAMKDWMNSPGHKANILTAEYQSMGVGVFQVDGVYYWCQQFNGQKKQATPTNKKAVTETRTIEARTGLLDLSINHSSLNLKSGKTATLEVRSCNQGFPYYQHLLDSSGLSFELAKTGVVTISKTGVITPIGKGSTTITVNAKNGVKLFSVSVKADCKNVHTHSYTAATCTAPKTCKVCGAISGKKLGHTYSNDCDKACNRCKATRTVPGHNYKKIVTKATLTKDGKIKNVCTECGYTSSKVTTLYKASKISLSKTSYTYNGKVQKPSVVVKDSKGKTISSSHYTVTYASGRKNVGTYKVTIKMKGNYSGTKTLTFKINPPKTSISKLTGAKKSLKVYVSKKSTQVTGYQIQYSTSKTFKSYKTKTVSSYKTTSATLSSLSAKKTYYVRVRTYKTVNGTKYYSGWSTIKYTKTK